MFGLFSSHQSGFLYLVGSIFQIDSRFATSPDTHQDTLHMTATALQLADLAQQLSQKQSEIEALRHAYEQRLQGLQQRKQALEAELRQVDTEIQAATRKGTPAAAASKPAPQHRRQPKAAAPAESTAKQTLLELLVAIVRERDAREGGGTGHELVRRKYQTTSTNLPKWSGSR